MKTEKHMELIKLLKILKKEQLTQEFCNNTTNIYDGNWDNTHLSKILTGKRWGNTRLKRMLTIDITAYLEYKWIKVY